MELLTTEKIHTLRNNTLMGALKIHLSMLGAPQLKFHSPALYWGGAAISEMDI